MCSPLLLLCYSELHITVSEAASVLSFQTLRAIRSVTMAHGYWCQEQVLRLFYNVWWHTCVHWASMISCEFMKSWIKTILFTLLRLTGLLLTPLQTTFLFFLIHSIAMEISCMPNIYVMYRKGHELGCSLLSMLSEPEDVSSGSDINKRFTVSTFTVSNLKWHCLLSMIAW